nr:tetratricopeptide repeat protein [uncultured Dongia sp.]
MIRSAFIIVLAVTLVGCAPVAGHPAKAESVSSQTVESQLEQAYMAYLARDFETAYDLLAPLAESGNPDAQAQLGTMYLLGNRVQKDPAKALELFRLAAAQNNAKAQLQIGGMYQMGLGLPKDPGLAIAWAERAVAQGYGPAEAMLARTYEVGFGVEQNYGEAMRLFRLAAAKGQFYGQAGVGRLYLRGQGSPRDLVEAYMWLTLASRHDHPALATMKQYVQTDIAASEREMTPAQRVEGQRRVDTWRPTIPCNDIECHLLP